MHLRFTIARFFCGCVYPNPKDLALFCPEHRGQPHRGYITGHEDIRVHQDTPIPEQALHPHRSTSNSHHILQNSPHNSIHTVTSVLDNDHNEWATPEAEMTGLCAPCFIDSNYRIQTRTAMCECGNQECPYRWCGKTQGLHALWRFHANGQSMNAIGIPEAHIFSQGTFPDQPQRVKEILKEEEKNLEEQIHRIAHDFHQQMKTPWHKTRNGAPAVYSNPWLEREHQRITKHPNTRDSAQAARTLLEKITRLTVIGAMAPIE